MAFIGDSYREPGRVEVTYALIFLNILSFYVVTFKMGANVVFPVGGVVPSEWFGASFSLAEQRPPEIISVLWSLFLHAGWMHLILNMLMLYLFGPNIEARLGRLNFLLFYLSCGSAGALFQVIRNVESQVPIIGASGAIFGLMGGYFIFFKDHFFRVDFGKRAKRDLIFPVYIVILFFIIIQVTQGLSPIQSNSIEPVAYFAHMGGFVCGAFLAFMHPSRKAETNRPFRVFRGGKR
ncbi:MAG: rhomboid family intramembrane serine protease [Acidobacteria bacterium]|nr:MAG: rhomboid family intramembrane serine protease [Acidobacteriota bacterium]PIE90798.1 MAG: rhomboid family intramembrane serine protease [Acidobacteriota bacterium]